MAEALSGIKKGEAKEGRWMKEGGVKDAAGVSMRAAELVVHSPSKDRKGKLKAIEVEEGVIMHCNFDLSPDSLTSHTCMGSQWWCVICKVVREGERV